MEEGGKRDRPPPVTSTVANNAMMLLLSTVTLHSSAESPWLWVILDTRPSGWKVAEALVESLCPRRQPFVSILNLEYYLKEIKGWVVATELRLHSVPLSQTPPGDFIQPTFSSSEGNGVCCLRKASRTFFLPQERVRTVICFPFLCLIPPSRAFLFLSHEGHTGNRKRFSSHQSPTGAFA